MLRLWGCWVDAFGSVTVKVWIPIKDERIRREKGRTYIRLKKVADFIDETEEWSIRILFWNSFGSSSFLTVKLILIRILWDKFLHYQIVKAWQLLVRTGSRFIQKLSLRWTHGLYFILYDELFDFLCFFLHLSLKIRQGSLFY